MILISRYDLFDARMRLAGTDTRGRIVTHTKDVYNRKYGESPAYKIVKKNDEEVSIGLMVYATQNMGEKTFSTLPDQIVNIGDTILWNEMHWLVTQIDFDDEIVREGRIVQCNRIIKWQNPETREIISRWCLATKPYTSNISEGNVISISNREYKIQLPYDNETRLVDVDKRFLLEMIGDEPKAYKVKSVDTLTNRYEDIEGGFLIWNLEQEQYSHLTDNKELMIANYIVPDTPPPAPLPLTCEIIGRSDIKCGGSQRTYRATFYDSDNNIDQAICALWTVNIPDILSKDLSYKIDGNSIMFSCKSNLSIVGTSFEILLTDNAGIYAPVSLEVEVVSTFG